MLLFWSVYVYICTCVCMCVLGVFIFMLSDTFVSTCVSILIIFMCLEICSAVDIQSPPQIAT